MRTKTLLILGTIAIGALLGLYQILSPSPSPGLERMQPLGTSEHLITLNPAVNAQQEPRRTLAPEVALDRLHGWPHTVTLQTYGPLDELGRKEIDGQIELCVKTTTKRRDGLKGDRLAEATLTDLFIQYAAMSDCLEREQYWTLDPGVVFPHLDDLNAQFPAFRFVVMAPVMSKGRHVQVVFLVDHTTEEFNIARRETQKARRAVKGR